MTAVSTIHSTLNRNPQHDADLPSPSPSLLLTGIGQQAPPPAEAPSDPAHCRRWCRCRRILRSTGRGGLAGRRARRRNAATRSTARQAAAAQVSRRPGGGITGAAVGCRLLSTNWLLLCASVVLFAQVMAAGLCICFCKFFSIDVCRWTFRSVTSSGCGSDSQSPFAVQLSPPELMQ